MDGRTHGWMACTGRKTSKYDILTWVCALEREGERGGGRTRGWERGARWRGRERKKEKERKRGVGELEGYEERGGVDALALEREEAARERERERE